MKKTFIFIIYIFPILVFGQNFAEFSTDTTRFRQHYREGRHVDLPDYIKDQEWIINGQKMTYGSEQIKVEVNANRLDTILYKGYRKNEFDTIICNISEPRNYKFFYNECCGAFNVQDEGLEKFIQGSIIYRLQSNNESNLYLGTLGEAGILVKKNSHDTLKVNCRSAMSPNIYNISFKQIENCQDSINCKEGICLQVQGENEPVWDYGFMTISTEMDFLFLPLSQKPLIVTYDPKTKKIKIE